ncbi:cardiolipin synthase B [Eikenella sp. S3360]|uniref:Cardiolipin synthase B n=1 Tax=Eikenella glucosivorans TaxID=2766967 RepID=A0ABS0NB69_9NEIS|nr:phospholipase D-like domain-containing protein [Eikenella glucosivorans]MBH5329531.1 cardiolipin synthase B [Eikenella glucosivorans]
MSHSQHNFLADQHPLLEQLHARSSSGEMHTGNSVVVLKDSGENFPAWLEAIEAAEEYVLIEMYIFAADDFGQRLRDLLIEKCHQGVRVVLVYDWLGSLWPVLRRFFMPLKQAGAEVVAYNPLGFASGFGLFSRDHRKSIVVDGHTAFVGGLCVSSAWEGNPAEGVVPWRDTGLKLQGPAVGEVVQALADTLHSQGKRLPENIHPPCPAPAGTVRAGVIATTPSNNNMMRLDLNALALANRNLWLTDAYFMPTRLYTQALINAANDGVDVRILVPRTSDIRWIGRVSRTRYRSLLEAGVRVFEWNGPMIHAKSAIADGQWARVGSTNLNFASWHMNRELDVVIEDAVVVRHLEQMFLQDLANATEIVLNESERRAAIRRRHQMLSRRRIGSRQQAQAAARQLLQLSSVFRGNFYGTRTVDENEAKSYLSLGISMLVVVLLLWFAPYLLAGPVMLLLLAGGLSTTVHAVRQLMRFHRQKNAARKAGKPPPS